MTWIIIVLFKFKFSINIDSKVYEGLNSGYPKFKIMQQWGNILDLFSCTPAWKSRCIWHEISLKYMNVDSNLRSMGPVAWGSKVKHRLQWKLFLITVWKTNCGNAIVVVLKHCNIKIKYLYMDAPGIQPLGSKV
jgi:hypothetical protein